MKPQLLPNAFLLLALTSACSSGAINLNKNPAVPLTDPKTTKPYEASELQKEIEQIASAAKGRVGVAALLLETGETVSLDPHGHLPMQSVYKLPIGMAVMKQVDAGKIRLDQKVRVTKDDFISAGQHSPVRDNNPNGVDLSVSELLLAQVTGETTLMTPPP